jgi:hypothetical protein
MLKSTFVADTILNWIYVSTLLQLENLSFPIAASRVLPINKGEVMVKRVLVSGLILGACAALLSTIVSNQGTAEEAKKKTPPQDAAVERARREVRMLDDIYKTAVVLVTEHYVKTDSDLAAGSAFKVLFDSIAKKGWHEARLVDATGQPYSDLNLPKEGFEKKAIAELLAGKPSYDQVITEDGKRYLLAATAIPVVMEKCIMCHENYRNVEKGKAIGAISYKVPVQE